MRRDEDAGVLLCVWSCGLVWEWKAAEKKKKKKKKKKVILYLH